VAIELTDSITLFLREDWGARTPRCTLNEQGWNAHEAFLHHTADSYIGLDSLDEQKARMRSYQRLHMDTNGWCDIGYHFVVFPPFETVAGTDIPARGFQGRERNKVPAAPEGHNRGTLAVAVVGNYQTDFLHRNTIYALEVLLNRYDALRTLGGHRDVVSTNCPGGKLYAEIPHIADICGLKVYG